MGNHSGLSANALLAPLAGKFEAMRRGEEIELSADDFPDTKPKAFVALLVNELDDGPGDYHVFFDHYARLAKVVCIRNPSDYPGCTVTEYRQNYHPPEPVANRKGVFYPFGLLVIDETFSVPFAEGEGENLKIANVLRASASRRKAMHRGQFMVTRGDGAFIVKRIK